MSVVIAVKGPGITVAIKHAPIIVAVEGTGIEVSGGRRRVAKAIVRPDVSRSTVHVACIALGIVGIAVTVAIVDTRIVVAVEVAVVSPNVSVPVTVSGTKGVGERCVGDEKGNRKNKYSAHRVSPEGVGWQGRVRTDNHLINSQMLYR